MSSNLALPANSPRYPPSSPRPSAPGDFETISLNEDLLASRLPSKGLRTVSGSSLIISPSNGSASARSRRTDSRELRGSSPSVNYSHKNLPSLYSSSPTRYSKYGDLARRTSSASLHSPSSLHRPYVHRQVSATQLQVPPARVSSQAVKSNGSSPNQTQRPNGSSSPLSQTDPELPFRPHSELTKSSNKPRRSSFSDDEEHSADDVEVSHDVIFWNVPLTPDVKAALQNDSRSAKPDDYFARGGRSTRHSIDSIESPELNRNKSWIEAMDNLSEEAKDLTFALEGYRDLTNKKIRQEHDDRLEVAKKKYNLDRRSSSPAPVIERPKIEHVSVKEKHAAVNSLTRPTHLPKKTKKEEEKHMAQFRKMMQLSHENERKKKQELRQKFDEFFSKKKENDAYWSGYVIPKLPSSLLEPRIRDMIWTTGIPDRHRQQIWSLLIGNSLGITKHDFEAYVQQANSSDTDWREVLFDVAVTFPDLKLFQENGPLNSSLVEILKAYVMYSKDHAYSRSLSGLAATALLDLDPLQSFIATANIINHQPLLTFHTKNSFKLSMFHVTFDHLFATHMPSLYHHFTSVLRLQSESYLAAFLVPLFTRHLPLDFISRIWDLVFLDMASDFPPLETDTGTTKLGMLKKSNLGSTPTRFETLLVAICLAILKHLNTKLLIATKIDVLGLIGWDAEPIKFDDDPNLDPGVASAVKEITFVKNVESFL
ncbi:rab-GTPase-TBC domain-containing protein [Lipomyces japonicus]|uniref:rab-GTPase-TBC domain-containing protein n=1 Tax=Lipomyces japonicus TaxID=56871 RepID=UPI0034D01534